MLRSEGHKMYGLHVTKKSPMDTKRWIAEDGMHTLAYGHKNARTPMDDYLDELLNELQI